MEYSESAAQLRQIIEKAIDDHQLTQSEMNSILSIATRDNHIDKHEQILLGQLQEMIENKMVKIIP